MSTAQNILRIVVADRAEARFYDVPEREAPMELVGVLKDAAARQQDRDLVSDRPGTVFDHAAAPGQRRGSVGHHGTGGERSAHRHESERFARLIASNLDEDHGQHRFGRLLLVAGPPFLGELRSALSPSVAALVAGEVPRDLIHTPESSVRAQIHSYLHSGESR